MIFALTAVIQNRAGGRVHFALIFYAAAEKFDFINGAAVVIIQLGFLEGHAGNGQSRFADSDFLRFVYTDIVAGVAVAAVVAGFCDSAFERFHAFVVNGAGRRVDFIFILVRRGVKFTS